MDVNQRLKLLGDNSPVAKTRMDATTKRLDGIQECLDGINKRLNTEGKRQYDLEFEVDDLGISVKELEDEIYKLQNRDASPTEQSKLENEPVPELSHEDQGQYKSQLLKDLEDEFKQRLQELEQRRKIDNLNSIARVQNSFVKSKMTLITPLKSKLNEKDIPRLPRNSEDLEKLEVFTMLSILEHLGTKQSGDPDIYFHRLWRETYEKEIGPSETTLEILDRAKREEETEALRLKLRVHIGLPMQGLDNV